MKLRYFHHLKHLFQDVLRPKTIQLMKLSDQIHRKLQLTRYFKRFREVTFFTSDSMALLYQKYKYVITYTNNRMIEDFWSKWWVIYVLAKEEKALMRKYHDIIQLLAEKNRFKDKKIMIQSWNMWRYQMLQNIRIKRFKFDRETSTLIDTVKRWKTYVSFNSYFNIRISYEAPVTTGLVI